MTSKNRSNALCLCPLDGVIDIIGKKWSLLVINELGNHGKLRYKEIMTELQGVSPSTLAALLRDFESEDLIKKEVFNEIPPRVEYTLTPRGRELRKAIIPLIKWSTKKGNYKMHCSCTLLRR